jgi:hypothetical protein
VRCAHASTVPGGYDTAPIAARLRPCGRRSGTSGTRRVSSGRPGPTG